MAKVLSIAIATAFLLLFLSWKNGADSKAALVKNSDLIGIADLREVTKLDAGRAAETGYPYRIDGISEDSFKGEVPKYLTAYAKAG